MAKIISIDLSDQPEEIDPENMNLDWIFKFLGGRMMALPAVGGDWLYIKHQDNFEWMNMGNDIPESLNSLINMRAMNEVNRLLDTNVKRIFRDVILVTGDEDRILFGKRAHTIQSFGCTESQDKRIENADNRSENQENVPEKLDIVPKTDVPVTPINPAHYRAGKWETIEFIENWSLDFCLGNAVKYISRAGKKDPTKTIEDLNKAIWYIERAISQTADGNRRNHIDRIATIDAMEYCKSLYLSYELCIAVTHILGYGTPTGTDVKFLNFQAQKAIEWIRKDIGNRMEGHSI